MGKIGTIKDIKVPQNVSGTVTKTVGSEELGLTAGINIAVNIDIPFEDSSFPTKGLGIGDPVQFDVSTLNGILTATNLRKATN